MRSIRLLSPLTLLVALSAIAAPAPTGTRVTRWEEFGTVTIEEFASGQAALDPSTAGASATAERLGLALGAATPNPARGGALVVDVGLPSADPARLELLDVMGRRVASLELEGLGAGRHSVELGVGQRLAPGLYLLRLTQAGSARVTRVAFVE